MKEFVIPFHAGGASCKEALHAVLVKLWSQYNLKHGTTWEECRWDFGM